MGGGLLQTPVVVEHNYIKESNYDQGRSRAAEPNFSQMLSQCLGGEDKPLAISQCIGAEPDIKVTVEDKTKRSRFDTLDEMEILG